MASNEENTEPTDMENWMTNLPPRLKSLPLVYLAIPGNLKIYCSVRHLTTVNIYCRIKMNKQKQKNSKKINFT